MLNISKMPKALKCSTLSPQSFHSEKKACRLGGGDPSLHCMLVAELGI